MKNEVTSFVCYQVIDEYDATRFSDFRCSVEELAELICREVPKIIARNCESSGVWGAVTQAALRYVADADWSVVAEYVIERTNLADWPELEPDAVDYIECESVVSRREYPAEYLGVAW